MDWKPETDVTMDFAVHSHEDDRTTAVITQLVELANLLSNHLGSNIDPNVKPTTPSQKKGQKVDVVRLTAKPIEQTISKGFVPNRRVPSRDFTGDSISKEDEDDNIENLVPQLALAGGALAASEIKDDLTEERKAMNPMSTSEGKALLRKLQEVTAQLEKFLDTTRVDSPTALKPNDMK
tara:strand:+ start:99 stop:635 length:537 start_codon:yes stop_codon:yes gene_type:complete